MEAPNKQELKKKQQNFLQKTAQESCMELIRSKPKSLVNFLCNATKTRVH